MANFRRSMRQRRKLLSIWLILIGLALLYQLHQYCISFSEGTCIIWLKKLTLFASAAIAALVLLIIFLMRRRNLLLQKESKIKGFKTQPWTFDGKVIYLTGQVEMIFENRFSEILKRKFRHLFRLAIADGDQTNRYVHQRFLLSSPGLKEGESILIIHNTEFGSIPLRKGLWVDVQGKYLHQCGMRRGFFGMKKTFYGRVHYTHQPLGFVRVRKDKASDIVVKEVTLKQPGKERN